MTDHTITAAALLANSAADMVRELETLLCRMVPPKDRTREQHGRIHRARKFYNTVVERGDIRDAAELERVAAAVGALMFRTTFVAAPGADTSGADLQGGF